MSTPHTYPAETTTRQHHRASLRLYLAPAPGAGKTHRMLEDAGLRHEQNEDIVIGFLDSRSRPHTAELAAGIERIPPLTITSSGITLEEINLDAILARKPAIVIIDDLAHTNIPGSPHRRRYEDVLQLLDQGIDVWTSVNIQHIESLNDVVYRSSGYRERERVPDSILRRADQIVTVDITIEELRSRLRHGLIYPQERIEPALAGFFRKGNLSTMRELTLRMTAERVADRAAEYRRQQGLEQSPIPERVMVCISDRTGTEKLLRVGARIAGRLATDWFAVYVEADTNLTPEEHRRLQHYLTMAEEMGAQVVKLAERKVADTLIQFAHQQNISHVVFGQSARSRFDILLRGSIINRFLAEMRDTTVQVVPLAKSDGNEPS